MEKVLKMGTYFKGRELKIIFVWNLLTFLWTHSLECHSFETISNNNCIKGNSLILQRLQNWKESYFHRVSKTLMGLVTDSFLIPKLCNAHLIFLLHLSSYIWIYSSFNDTFTITISILIRLCIYENTAFF